MFGEAGTEQRKKMITIKTVNCFQCTHFSVTWNPKFPKACKFFNFTSVNMPSVTVFQSTGKECIAFEKKEGKK